jgi:hypothetical protein
MKIITLAKWVKSTIRQNANHVIIYVSAGSKQTDKHSGNSGARGQENAQINNKILVGGAYQ